MGNLKLTTCNHCTFAYYHTFKCAFGPIYFHINISINVCRQRRGYNTQPPLWTPATGCEQPRSTMCSRWEWKWMKSSVNSAETQSWNTSFTDSAVVLSSRPSIVSRCAHERSGRIIVTFDSIDGVFQKKERKKKIPKLREMKAGLFL